MNTKQKFKYKIKMENSIGTMCDYIYVTWQKALAEDEKKIQ